MGWSNQSTELMSLVITSITDFQILQKFNSCSIHGDEAGVLSLGILYLITEKMHAL